MLDWFDKHNEQKRARRAQAERQPAVDVTSIIPPHGASLVRTRGYPAEEVVVFHVWRVAEGPLEAGKPRLVQESSGASPPFGSLRGVPAGSVITVKARLARAADETLGVVAGRFTIVEADRPFAEALHRQKSPPKFHDSNLGTLTSDDLLGWMGEVVWLGKSCAFSIDQLGDLPVAHALFRDQQRWTTNAVNFATERLLGLKNNVWRGEEEMLVSTAEFGERLSLASITVESGGKFTLGFDDGNLFWGHSINVEGNLSDGMTDASLAG